MGTPLNVQRYRALWGVETPPPDASVDLAKNWATKTNGVVADGEFSSKAYAQSTDGNAPAGGSSKQWAEKTGAPVADGGYSAKHWAALAAAAAASATGAVIATQPLVNGQNTPADVEALDFSAGLIAGIFLFVIERVTTGGGAVELYQSGLCLALKAGASYQISPLGVTGDEAGIEFSITPEGKTQYESNEITGDESVSRLTTMHWSIPTPA